MRFIILMFSIVVFSCIPQFIQAKESPNVLLISVDDLNDWVGVLKGHPQSLTPNIDRLASQSVLFANAHCQAPVCQPSRASMMVSRFPSSTGLYFLNPGLQQSEVTRNEKTIPEAFAEAGYNVMGAGKLFHSIDNKRVFSAVGEYGGNFGAFGPRPQMKISQPHGHPLWDWGAYPEKTEEMPDFKIASWAQEKLSQESDQPYFLAVGFFRPHVPMYVPQKWYDKHPREQVQLPLILQNDNEDLSDYARNLVTLEHVSPEHEWMKESGQWPHAVQSYLASISFVDHCVGMVLDAVEEREDRQNTIICLYSDHGFHLGEKERWAKRSLWEDETRIPLMISGPAVQPAVCRRPVGLIDIYPTLLAMTDQQSNPGHEGQSLVPLLENPELEWERPAITTFGKGNHSVRSTRWRFISYLDGSEELYDHQQDPHEWKNLAGDEHYTQVLQEHRRWLPSQERPILGKDSTGHKAYAAAQKALQK